MKDKTIKTYRVSDGFIEKTITATSTKAAAKAYAIVSSSVEVVQVDDDGNEVGESVDVEVSI